jgi:hypothetical protein
MPVIQRPAGLSLTNFSLSSTPNTQFSFTAVPVDGLANSIIFTVNDPTGAAAPATCTANITYSTAAAPNSTALKFQMTAIEQLIQTLGGIIF